MDVNFKRLIRFFMIVIGVACLGAMFPHKLAAQDKKSPLLKFEIVDLIQSKSIPMSLTGKRGNKKRGEALMIERSKGNCLACHQVTSFEKKAKKEIKKEKFENLEKW